MLRKKKFFLRACCLYRYSNPKYKRLADDSLYALAALMVIIMGLFAAMLAAAVNGLALPLFLNHYLDAPPEKLSAVKPVVNYNTALNHAFDYVYTGASCLATLLPRLGIFRTIFWMKSRF